jgi:hypothetical protein
MKKWVLILILCAIVLTAASVISVTVLVPLISYNQAETALNEGRYEDAIAAFAELGDYKDSSEKLLESRYMAAKAKLDEGKYEQAMQEFSDLKSYRDSPDLYREARFRWGKALMDEGAYRDSLELFLADIEYSGVRDELKNVYEKAVQSGEIAVAYDAATALRDFEAIAGLNLQVIAAGRNHVVALRRDGTVVAAGNNDKGQCNVQDWTDIIAVAAGFEYTVGLKSDGTVVATGSNHNGQCDVQDWTDIVTIYVGNTATDTIGVKSDGTIVGVGGTEGDIYHQQIPGKADGMVKICPGWRGILVLMEDGDVELIPPSTSMKEINRWMSIKDMAIGTGHAVGLMVDGTVVTAGRNTSGTNDVDGWTDIIALAASNSNTAGLKKDGTVMVAGDDKKGQKDAEEWKDIVAVSVGPGYVAGLRIDGTVVAAGQITRAEENEKLLEEIASWQNIGPAS